VPTERIGYMFLNAQAGPTQDVRVRRAVAHAIDRAAIIEALLQGYGKAVDVVLTPANFGFVDDVKGWPYDPAKAKALIAEAGAAGQTLSFLTSPAYDRRVVEALLLAAERPLTNTDLHGLLASAHVEGEWPLILLDLRGCLEVHGGAPRLRERIARAFARRGIEHACCMDACAGAAAARATAHAIDMGTPGVALRVPLVSFKVIAAIHWQALKLWVKGARFHASPPPPGVEVILAPPAPAAASAAVPVAASFKVTQ
jgi:hypothetical protein